MKNTYGSALALTIFGESHGAAIGAVLDGMAAGVPVDEARVAACMDKRRARGDGLSTARVEADQVQFLSGVVNGHTTGTAIALMIENQNTRSGDYAKTADLLRPGHADYTAYAKYHGFQDARGGGHFSGRVTAALVAGGAIVLDTLSRAGIDISTHIARCAGISDTPFALDDPAALAAQAEALVGKPEGFARLDTTVEEPRKAAIRAAGADGDSVGGILETAILGLPAGIPSAVFAVANIIIQSAINSLGTEVMAASSAAMSLEYVCYNLLNSFSQACTTFVGQNHGARQIGRCTKTLKVCLVEGGIVALTTIIVIVGLGREILSLFNSDPNIVSIGYIRVCSIFPAYTFSMFYENMSGYLRGFGISLTPALITMICVCGIRFYWVFCVFPHFRTFANIMMVYPISLGTTAFFMVVAVLLCHPARTYRATQAKATAR